MAVPKRAARRQADKRIKSRTKRRLKRSWMSPEAARDPRVIGKRAAVHDVGCSCAMCGNPRKFTKGDDKITRQELKANRTEKEEREDSAAEEMIQHWLDRC